MTRSPNFLSMLGEAAVAALFKHWIVRLYTPGELIVAHGESGRDVFFILEGRARVTLFPKTPRDLLWRPRPRRHHRGSFCNRWKGAIGQCRGS